MAAGPAAGQITLASVSCHLPSGKSGLCVPLADCSHLTSLIGNLQKPLPKDVGLLLRESFFCSSGGGGEISVCCPPDGLTVPPDTSSILPDRTGCGLQANSPAVCVEYTTCSPFVLLMSNLRKPLPSAVPNIVRSSYLCGTAESGGVKSPKICCPAAALGLEQVVTPTPPPAVETSTDKFHGHAARSLLADPVTCGIPLNSVRIVGGKAAEIGQYPWLVNLGYTQAPRPTILFKCGGSLVGKRYVLTAAHCVTQLPSGFGLALVRVGEYDLSKDPDCDKDKTFCSDPPQDIKIEKVIFHESYGKPKAFQNDIALLKLVRDVTISDYVSPICLPYGQEDDNYLNTRTIKDGAEHQHQTEVAGWGATTRTGRDPAVILQYLEVNVTDRDLCQKTYAERGGVLTEKQICAGGQKDKDSCVGDSGSGLMRSRPTDTVDRWDIIGVVSFGPRLCGTEGVPGVYTRVNSYLDWILDTVAAVHKT